MYRIMIVEDELAIAQVLERQLGRWGYDVRRVDAFDRVMEEFLTYDPQLVLLDIRLPYFNGYHWCTEIRKISKTPIIFISSAGENMNIVMAMSMGGDDFLVKPFDLDVVTAKVQALLRRTYEFAGQTDVLQAKGLILQLADATLLIDGERVELTKNEYGILRLLLENKGRIVSREAIMQRLWDTDSFVDDNTLTVNITRLRKKLEEAGAPDVIVTRKGIGYLIEGA